jgi:broad specificity phosphatase PhoE
MARPPRRSVEPRVYFITHPNVVIDPAVPVPEWPLSIRGRERMAAGLSQPWVRTIGAIYCSAERKARDGAAILGAHLGLPPHVIDALGENDRSATGFLPPDEFERVADAFFAAPDCSVRGWETARAAQARIVTALGRVLADGAGARPIAIVSHGAVGTLLYCHLAGEPISRTRDQPANGGGNYFSFSAVTLALDSWWLPFDRPAREPAAEG